MYILNDKCIADLYSLAQEYFSGTSVIPIRDSRGIILRYQFESAKNEYENPNINVYKKIEGFLAKIENPAIIEVHTVKNQTLQYSMLKNWEISTLVANNIESLITEPQGLIEQNRMHSVGYGEFLPDKNTSNNGVKYLNRVDIIILCNISGE